MTSGYRIRNVILVGPAATGQGGIASVIRGYLNTNPGPVRFHHVVTTPVSGGLHAKLVATVLGCARLVRQLWRLPGAPVHVHSSIGASFWRKLLLTTIARAVRRPVVLHLHSGQTPEYVSGGGPLRRAAVWAAFRMSSAVIVLDPTWIPTISAVAKCNVFAVPNGVLVPNPRPTPSARTVVSLGRLCVPKGTFDLVDAFGRINVSDVTLVLAGDGDTSVVAEAAHKAGVAARVETPGWLDANEGAALLRRATVFALASHSEGLPMAVLEAMAAGVAVVATRVGALPNLISHGENGLLVDPSDVAGLSAAIAALLEDDALRSRLSAQGRRTIEEGYALEHTMNQLEVIYESIA